MISPLDFCLDAQNGMNRLRKAAVRVIDAQQTDPRPPRTGFAQLASAMRGSPPVSPPTTVPVGRFRAETEILSSLPLQMLLYFNLRYSVVYFLVTLLLAEAKVRSLL